MTYKKIALAFVLALGLGSFASVASAATLSISPATASYNVGDTFTVSVNLDTKGVSIDGVDIHYLHFNPSLLQVVDANTNVAGTQATAGTLMPLTPSNTVDNQNGTITFSQIVAGGQHYQGSGTLLSITFRALAAGSSTVTFDATPGSTTDSNVASNGSDVLSSASSGQFALVVGSSSGGGGGSGTTGSGTTGSGSGGAGGSGMAVSATAVTNFSAVPTDSKVLLSWNNPTDSTYVSTMIVRKQDNIPTGPTDGIQVYNGTGTSFADINVKNGNIYYYAAFAVLTSGTVQTPSMSSYAVPRIVTTQQTVTTSPTRAVVLLTRTLTRGSTGDDVTLLQLFLIAKGHLAAGNAIGVFGPMTERAVQSFQRSAGIASSGTPASTGYGLVGKMTRAAINAILPSLALDVGGTTPAPAFSGSFTRDLTLGATGEDVRALQQFLNSHGFAVSSSGAGAPGQESDYFGPATRSALARYQASKGISPAAGYFGPLTRGSVGQ